MSEHPISKITELTQSIRREQLLAQLYDIKESNTMMIVVVERYKKELKNMEKRITNMINLVEGMTK